jgi:uncharacterized protein with HEPN domain
MPRNYLIYLDDIQTALVEIADFSKDIPDLNALQKNKMAFRAIERNLEIIGEAVKNIPIEIRECAPDIEWKKIAGLRDIIVHTYFNINPKIIWDILQNYAPSLLLEINRLRQSIDAGHCT